MVEIFLRKLLLLTALVLRGDYQITVKQPANMSEEQAFEELMKDIDDAVDAVLAPESGGAPPYLQ